MSVLASLLRRELLLAVRQGGGIGTAIGFLLTILVMLPIGIGPDQDLLQTIAPGGLWIAVLLSVMLSAERIFQADYEDGSLEIMTMGPAALEMVVVVKAFAHWLSTGLPLAILAPLLGVLINVQMALILPMIIAMVIGSLALSLLATLGAAITVGLRRGGMLVSLLILPLNIPVLIFGLSASSGQIAGPNIAASSLLILSSLVLGAIVLVPFAAAAALKAHMR